MDSNDVKGINLDGVKTVKLVGIADFAHRLGISEDDVWDLMDDSAFPLPAVEGRGGPRWFATQLDAYAKARQR